MILHGEQETEVLSHPIPLEGNFVSKSKVIGVYDKGQGKGAVIVRETLTIDAATNKKIFRNVTTIFVRGLGGFGVSHNLPIIIVAIYVPYCILGLFILIHITYN
jgi:hypothetical protein